MLGVENILDMPMHPIAGAYNPFGSDFDSSVIFVGTIVGRLLKQGNCQMVE
jgi:hypothetical protein